MTPQAAEQVKPLNDASAPMRSASAPAVALNVGASAAPEWVQLLPAGPIVQGYDGRRWTLNDPDEVVQASGSTGQPIAIDYEHGSDLRGPVGLPAPASGWIDQLEVREGAVWGRVDWTATARDYIGAREYRYLSPTFSYTRDGDIIAIIGAGLTNRPNLSLTALNRRDNPAPQGASQKETAVNIHALRQALDLDDKIDDDAVIDHAAKAIALNRATAPTQAPRTEVDLSKFAPRADLAAAVERAQAAEARLAEIEAEQQEGEIQTALNRAMDAGKIAPASQEHYLAMCRLDGGLERFKSLVETMPIIAGAAKTRAATKVETGRAGKLTDTELAICRATGVSETAYIAARDGAVINEKEST